MCPGYMMGRNGCVPDSLRDGMDMSQIHDGTGQMCPSHMMGRNGRVPDSLWDGMDVSQSHAGMEWTCPSHVMGWMWLASLLGRSLCGLSDCLGRVNIKSQNHFSTH